jgi:hypothetical protein
MKDRFDLENEISTLHVWTQILDSLNEGILEYDLSKDDTVNVISGLKVIIDLHADKMQDTLSQCFKLDQYNKNDQYTTDLNIP